MKMETSDTFEFGQTVEQYGKVKDLLDQYQELLQMLIRDAHDGDLSGTTAGGKLARELVSSSKTFLDLEIELGKQRLKARGQLTPNDIDFDKARDDLASSLDRLAARLGTAGVSGESVG